MRHKVYGKRLGRDSAHRKALRKNLISDLLCYEKVKTTEAKARMLRPAAEKIITLAKRGLVKGQSDKSREVHARRLVASRISRFRTIQTETGDEQVDIIKKLFDEIAPRFIERPGGYTRLVKVGKRLGDNADMAVLMLVDDNLDE